MRNRVRDFMARQFGYPRGLVGRFVGRRLAEGNVYDAQWTIGLLDLQPTSRVLEIGFGPGVSTQMAGERAHDGFVAGVDHSALMVEVASKRNAAMIEAGRIELREGDVAALPYPDDNFDTAFSLHSIYFWPDPHGALKQLRQVLKQGGLLAITIQPKDQWDPSRQEAPNMTLYYSGDIVSIFQSAGFRDLRVERPPEQSHANLECILGTK